MDMKLFRSSHRVAACAVALFASAASAQEAPAADTAPVEAAPVAAEPAPAPVMAPVEEAPMEEAPAEEAPAEDAAEEEGGLSIGMFADAYYNFDWNLPPQSNLGANSVGHTAYVNSQGFGLAFLGLDASYSAGTVSATTSLRFGSGTNQLIGQGGNPGIENVWQAYVSWAPTEKLTLDLGQYATVYGAEVGESWMNLNYTRGALYFAYQPFWHTGLRAAYQATDELAVKLLVANGVNTALTSDTRNGPSTRAPDLGLQLAYAGEQVSAYLGYYGNPIKPDNRLWSHFVDLVVVGAFGDATIVFNADLGVANLEPADSEMYFGVSLAGGYKLTPEWGLAARGEFLMSPELGEDPMTMETVYLAPFGSSLVTGTLTVEYNVSDSMVIRLDNRLEMADAEIFATKDDTSKTYISSVLGVAVHTN